MGHEDYLEYCLSLGLEGMSRVSPNPCVGAVIVHEGRVLSEGWHRKYGGMHAEREAISKVRPEDRYLLPDSTLYVSLEPCNHHGKTPPCTEYILESGIKKVAVGLLDPNPLMGGSSLDWMTAHGIKVMGPFFPDIYQYAGIRPFKTNMNRQRPYIILKWAQSLDRYISKSGKQTKITDKLTDILVHKWRSEVDGILVGFNTFQTDHPQLTTRHWSGENPARYVVARQHGMDGEHEGFRGLDPERLQEELHRIFMKDRIGIILVEGGSKTLMEFIRMELWDEARVITNTFLSLGEGVPAPVLAGNIFCQYALGKDNICFYRP